MKTKSTGAVPGRSAGARWFLLLLCLGGSGCQTPRAIHYVAGEAYRDHIAKVERAWIGTNSVRVWVTGTFGSSGSNGNHTLHFAPLDASGESDARQTSPVLLRRSCIAAGWTEGPTDEVELEACVSRESSKIGVFTTVYHKLVATNHPTPVLLTDESVLGMPAATEGNRRTSGSAYTWYACKPAYHYRPWALPVVLAALAGDSAFLMACGLADVHLEPIDSPQSDRRDSPAIPMLRLDSVQQEDPLPVPDSRPVPSHHGMAPLSSLALHDDAGLPKDFVGMSRPDARLSLPEIRCLCPSHP